ncbi:MAG: hypothetical protein NT163_12425 [Chlorobiales bacterium]|nr:hypothetical protein [Chlorobiales bacterium]
MKTALSIIAAIVTMHFASAPVVHAAEQPSAISLYGQATYGAYSNSVERSKYTSSMFALTYQKPDNYSASLYIMNSTLYWKHSLGSIHTVAPEIGLTKWISVSPEDLMGIRVAVTPITSDDSNADRMIVPYMSIMGKSRDGSAYVDLGYAYSNYIDTTVNQITASYGFSLFNSQLWLRTRLYYLDLGNQPVEGMNNTTAIEQKLTWYAIPQKLSLTFSGLIGRRVHGYDPDSGIVYTLPDTQHGSGGVTIGYSINPALHLYGEVDYESYSKQSISNNYGVTYGTVGLNYYF